MIYLDNAATTLHKPPDVAEAMLRALSSMGNSGRGVNAASLHAARDILDARMLIADLFGVRQPQQIAFTANATEALNIVLKGLLKPGDHVITTQAEHNSVLRPLYQLEKTGAEITILPCSPAGLLDYDDFDRRVRANTRAIVCTHASNVTGNLFDIRRISAAAKAHGLVFIVDASQTAGILPVHVEDEGIDILCFTGHKGLMGPQGTGGLFVREGLTLEPLLSGGTGVHSYDTSQPEAMPEHLEAGTLNGHGIAGLQAALSFIRKIGLSEIGKKEEALTRHFIAGAKRIPGVTLYGDTDSFPRAPVVSLNVGDLGAERVSDALATDFGIATRAGAHCAPLMHQALGTADRGTVRFSFSYYTTLEEIDTALDALRQIARQAEKQGTLSLS